MKTYKQFFCLLLALAMAFSLIPLSAEAEDTIDSGNCGEYLTWVLTTDGTLTISGTGEMADYVSDYPGWYKHRASLTKAVLEEGITSVSTCAFWDCQQLRWVQLPKTLTYIGSRAFERCFALELVEFAGPVLKKFYI